MTENDTQEIIDSTQDEPEQQKPLSFTAPTIDSFVDRYDHGFDNPEQPSADLVAAMDPLFTLLAPLAPCKENDEAKILWIEVPRGNIEDWESFEDAKDYDEVESYEEYENLWKDYYPEETKWYRLTIGEGKDRYKFRSVAVDNTGLISADLNNGVGASDATWKEESMITLLPLLTRAAQRSMDMLKAGTYNDYVAEHLPYQHRIGVIKRSDEWKADPEAKKYVWENMDEETYAAFKSLLPTNSEDKIGRIKSFTANDFFKACYEGYKACGYDLDDLDKPHFMESRRANTKSPMSVYARAYLRYADGRDEGLTGTGGGLNEGPGIDFDSADAWDKWYFDKERFGGHPWEVVRGGNSTHVGLCVVHDESHIGYLYRAGEISEDEYKKRRESAGYYFVVAGKHRGWEAIKFFVAIREAGYPVVLNDAEELAARYDGSDYIGIVPHRMIPKYCEELFPEKYGHVIDAMNIYSDEEYLLPYVEWLPEDKAELVKES